MTNITHCWDGCIYYSLVDDKTLPGTPPLFPSCGRGTYTDGSACTWFAKRDLSYSFDEVENPSHYCEKRRIQPVEVIEDWGLNYCLGCVVKYIARYNRKGSPRTDIHKAEWYLKRAISQMPKCEELREEEIE
jgi:hypothetical protein